MDEICEAAIAALQKNDDDDPIKHCHSDHTNDVLGQTDALFRLADEKLHIFPYKDVQPCWFRLYTDTSIAKAIKLIQTHPTQLEGYANSTQVSMADETTWVDEVISLLDMALIMAGGLGREHLIHKILTALENSLKGQAGSTRNVTARRNSGQKFDDENSGRPRKRQRVTIPSPSSKVDDFLPSKPTVLPRIVYPVPRIQSPSLETFRKHIYISRKPIVLTSSMEHWPAMTEWQNHSFWLRQTLGGRRLVPVEVGRSYTDEGWGQRIMPFREFLNAYIYQNEKDSTVRDMPTGYLAQHMLFDQIPTLRKDLPIPDYIHIRPPLPDEDSPVARSTVPSKAIPPGTALQNIWFGPAWTISPLHYDPYHNLLAQIVGKKYIRLYAPEHTDSLFPRSATEMAPDANEPLSSDDELNQSKNVQENTPQEHDHKIEASSAIVEDVPKKTINMSNTSEIDFAAIELSPSEDWDEIYPGLSKIPYIDCILEEGEMLYIPIGWWHYVRSCSVGISVSFWWGGKRGGGLGGREDEYEEGDEEETEGGEDCKG